MQSFSAVQTNKISIGKNIVKTKESLFVSGDTRIMGKTFIDNVLNTSQKIAIGEHDPAVSLDIDAKDAIKIPVGTSRDRPNTSNKAESIGYIRFNTDLNHFEGFGKDNSWNALGGGNSNINLDIDKIADRLILSGNMNLKNKLNAKEIELTSLTPNLILTYPGMSTKELTPNYSNYIYTSPSGSLNINPSINNTTGNVLNLLYNKGGGSSSAYEYVSRIRMVGQNDGSIKGENSARYGEIATQIIDATDNAESSNMEFAIMNNGTLTDLLVLCGRGYGTEKKESMIRIDTNILGKKDLLFNGMNNGFLRWDSKNSNLIIEGNENESSIFISKGNMVINNDILIKGNIKTQLELSEISDVTNIENGLEEILCLDCVSFYRKNANNKKKHYGVTKKNPQKINDNTQSYSADVCVTDYNEIIPKLVLSIQNLNTKIEKLENELDIIKSKSSNKN